MSYSVSTADVLDHLVGQSATPSNLGAQLERLRFGTHSAPDPFRARDDAENHMLQQAALIRCIDDYASRQVLPVAARAIEKVQKEIHRDQGAIAVGVLRAYHEWATQSQQRGLVQVYRYIASIAPKLAPKPPESDGVELVQLFREGKAKRCANLAAECYADSLLGLIQHLQAWNKRNK